MIPFLVALVFYRVTEVDWSSSGGTGDFVAYNFAMGTLQGYPAVRIAPVWRQKVYYGPVVPVVAPSVDVNWLSVVARRTFFEVEHDYRRYICIIDDDSSPPGDVPAKVVDDLDDVFCSLCFGRVKVCHPLQLMIVSLLPYLWQGFQRHLLLRGATLQTVLKV